MGGGGAGAVVGVALCAIAFGILIATVVGAVILRAAIALYNKMAGAGVSTARREADEGGRLGAPYPPAGTGITTAPREADEGGPLDYPESLGGGAPVVVGVPEPTFGKAMGIALIIALAHLAANFFIVTATGTGAAAANAGQQGAATTGANLLGQLIAVPVDLVIMAAVLTAMLPTSFGKAFLVALCHLLISLLIIGILLGVAFLVGLLVFRGP